MHLNFEVFNCTITRENHQKHNKIDLKKSNPAALESVCMYFLIK